MQTEQEEFAAKLREIPTIFHKALKTDDSAIRHRPAPGEWSAIEVLGHMIDKIYHWSRRAERILNEERPVLLSYDQDAEVRKHNYQNAEPAVLQRGLQQGCENFAVLVESVPHIAMQREGIHAEYGPITLRQCIEMPLDSVSEHLEQLQAAQRR